MEAIRKIAGEGKEITPAVGVKAANKIYAREIDREAHRNKIPKIFAKQTDRFTKLLQDEWWKSVYHDSALMKNYDFQVTESAGDGTFRVTVSPLNFPDFFSAFRVPVIDQADGKLLILSNSEMRLRARRAVWQIFVNEGEVFPPERELTPEEKKKYAREVSPSTYSKSLAMLFETQRNRFEDFLGKVGRCYGPTDWFTTPLIQYYRRYADLRLSYPHHGYSRQFFVDWNGEKLLILTDAEMRARAKQAWIEAMTKGE